MIKLRSIKQNISPKNGGPNDRPHDALPNFRNLGITLRILLISSGFALLQAILTANAWGEIPKRMFEIAALLAPILLACVLVLWAAQPWLDRLEYRHGAIAVGLIVMVLTITISYIASRLFHPINTGYRSFDALRYTLVSLIEAGLMLLYFRLRVRRLSRALLDARLQALRARIRPHFLFNSINAVLGIVRTQPKLAETALEDMADLFRMAMSEDGDLVPLRKEIQLCKQYVALEQLRLGDRLRVEWHFQDVPEDALVPSLLLQPLLENAVYHGIELLPEGGCVDVGLRRAGHELHLEMRTPYTLRKGQRHAGSKIALENIRQRLDMLFDVEARYSAERGEDFYHVEIVMPYVKEKSS